MNEVCGICKVPLSIPSLVGEQSPVRLVKHVAEKTDGSKGIVVHRVHERCLQTLSSGWACPIRGCSGTI